jgi:hypothetical protein
LWNARTAGAVQDPAANEGPPAPRAETPEKLPEKRASSGNEAPAPPAGAYDLKYLEGPGGKAVYVPDKATLEEYLEWREQRNARAGRGPAGANVTSLLFEGSADDERALITAVVDIEVAADDEWVAVPLRMSEGTLRAPAAYTGKGLAFPAPYQPEEGYAWWIKGKGAHQLKLQLSIPLRKQSAQRRVQLSLPATAVSLLKLRVAAPHVSARAGERSHVSTKTVGQESEIEVIGLGNRLDLAWQALPESSGTATALEVTTSMVATLVDGEAATLEATQLIQSLAQQGRFDEVRVSLPAGYDLLRLEGQEHRDHRRDPANGNQIIVQLKNRTTGPVELKWTVTSKLPAVGEQFALEGFDVERARLQTGYLAVVVVGDFRIIRQPDDDKYLQRVDLADLPGALRQTPASAAYRFLNRVMLRMKLQRIDPYVSVDPAMLLYLSSDAIELEGAYRLQVLRGSIAGFRLRWPGWKSQGWTITEAELPGLIELRTTEDAADPDLIRFEFPEPAKGAIEFRFRARHPRVEGAERTPLALPVPEAYGRIPTTSLAVVAADNVEADLRPATATLLRAVGGPDARIVVPPDWRSLKRTDYRIDSPRAELSLALAVSPRKIQSTTVVDAAIGRGAVTVRQRIAYDVAYERLSQLRFAIPEGVAPEQLRFFALTRTGAKELLFQIAPSTGRSPAEIQVTLDAPAIGRLEIEVRYARDRATSSPDARETVLSIPLVQSNDVVFSSTRFSCRDAGGRDAFVEGDGWQRQLAPDGSPVWVLPEARAQVSVRLAHLGTAPHGALVSRALIRSRAFVDGTIRSRAQYRLAEGISELSLAFPQHLEPVAFWWNDRELRAGPGAPASGGATWYEILVPDRAPAGERLLTIDFLTKLPPPSRLSSGFALEAPWLAEDESPAQVRWEVDLPIHQHLFTEPSGFAPEFHWRPGRLFWARHTDMATADLEQWIGAGSGPPFAAVSVDGNHYVFGTFGPPQTLEFRAMSQSGIVLIGAGTALLLGLVLVKWPATRHVLTLLTTGFVVALLAVWNAAPVQVLLQPAALGILLAIVAAAIDGIVHCRARPVTVTVTSANPFMAPASSHPRSPVAGVGSNEFTSVRSPPVLRPTGQLSESGKQT